MFDANVGRSIFEVNRANGMPIGDVETIFLDFLSQHVSWDWHDHVMSIAYLSWESFDYFCNHTDIHPKMPEFFKMWDDEDM